jgi:hypothetical protein
MGVRDKGMKGLRVEVTKEIIFFGALNLRKGKKLSPDDGIF